MISMLQRLIFILLSLLLVSCMHTQELGDASSVFYAPKEKIWEAAIKVLKIYPLKTINEDRAYIETEELKAHLFWKGPYQRRKDFAGYSSVILLRMNHQGSGTKVFIEKKVYKQKGFVSRKELVPSDGVEERVLLYRIARELSVEAALSKQL